MQNVALYKKKCTDKYLSCQGYLQQRPLQRLRPQFAKRRAPLSGWQAGPMLLRQEEDKHGLQKKNSSLSPLALALALTIVKLALATVKLALATVKLALDNIGTLLRNHVSSPLSPTLVSTIIPATLLPSITPIWLPLWLPLTLPASLMPSSLMLLGDFEFC